MGIKTGLLKKERGCESALNRYTYDSLKALYHLEAMRGFKVLDAAEAKRKHASFFKPESDGEPEESEEPKEKEARQLRVV